MIAMELVARISRSAAVGIKAHHEVGALAPYDPCHVLGESRPGPGKIAVLVVEEGDCGKPEDGGGRFLLLPPELDETCPRHRGIVVSLGSIGHHDEMDAIALCRPARERSPGVDVSIVRVRDDDENATLAGSHQLATSTRVTPSSPERVRSSCVRR